MSEFYGKLVMLQFLQDVAHKTFGRPVGWLENYARSKRTQKENGFEKKKVLRTQNFNFAHIF